MRLSKVIIRNFKRFGNVTFDIPTGGVVVAGPNNCGKTTLLQAITTWRTALECWLDMRRETALYGTHYYNNAPMSRQSLQSVPLLNLSALWHNAKPEKEEAIEITLVIDGTELPMLILYDTTEQLYVCPAETEDWQKVLEAWDDEEVLNHRSHLSIDAHELIEKFIFIPSISGISIEEPVYQDAKIQQLLGQNKPGEVLRNLLVRAHSGNKNGWSYLCGAIYDIFGYKLLAPNAYGANIIAEYRDGNVKLDIASAGSGFLQVLLLLALFVNRRECVLLLDEPDAHLHILLQDRVYAKLREFARISRSTLIMATHSERIINMTEPRNLRVVIDKPRHIVEDERAAIVTALTAIDNTDIMLAQGAPGVLYVEGHTDIAILRAWARVLTHPLREFLEEPFWKPSVLETGSGGIQSEKHFDALKLAKQNIVGVDLRDSDGQDKLFDRHQLYHLKNGLQRFYWRRYEIESYLIHPEAIANFAEQAADFMGMKNDALDYIREQLPPTVYRDPLADHDYLRITKAKDLLSHIFQAAGMEKFKDYARLAEAMPKEAIHPEVVEKLDAIAKAFGIMKP